MMDIFLVIGSITIWKDHVPMALPVVSFVPVVAAVPVNIAQLSTVPVFTAPVLSALLVKEISKSVLSAKIPTTFLFFI